MWCFSYLLLFVTIGTLGLAGRDAMLVMHVVTTDFGLPSMS